MRADGVVLTRFGGPEVLDVTSIDIPEPGPGEVLVRVTAVSLNHLDLEIRAGVSRLPIDLPHVLGREVVGEVVAAADADSPWSAGDRVLVLPHVVCGRCRNCLTGAANICLRGWMPGIHGWGGNAELMIAPSRGIVAAPDLDPVITAALPISFGTAWRALHGTAHVSTGEWVVVAGAGGALGHACLQVAALAGARPIALVRDPARADFVRRCGAEEVVVTSEADWPERVRTITGSRGADVIVDHVGGANFEGSIRALADRGRLVVAGGHGGEFPQLDVVDVFRRELRILGVRSQRPDDIEAVLGLAVEGRLTPHIAETMALKDVRAAHDLVASRSTTGKVVLQP
ncbi:zinc-binding dehydrogenase [Microbacterium sp. SLBN-146]|uniref:zinc-binding dehydrogenase n=1 Tax=Microbacterium sp. SLBN-146 TaxID=2768457 RepID=UPI00116BED61|nr:zinc-binding dehydrogenase [Microbacterium sp. SLBN-146]TQJ30735.1 NADPH:quinone reductase-like Zn-dependent oxidoreductase [Microbacterium sp. SLBN-146]